MNAWGLGVTGGIALSSLVAIGWTRRLGESVRVPVDIAVLALVTAAGCAWLDQRWFVNLLIAVPLSMWLAERRGMGWRRILDVFAAVVGLGQALGRLGCWQAGCCHGGPAAWGLVPPVPPPGVAPGVPIVPVPLIEAGLDLGLCALMSAWLWTRPAAGRVAAAWFVAHGLLRLGLDMLRTDLPRTYGLTGPQLGALAAVVFGLGLALSSRKV